MAALTYRDAGVLTGFLTVVTGVAAFAVVATRLGSETWYDSLAKPEWTPPDSVFPIAWGVLYVLMAVSGWLAWRAGAGRTAFVLFGVQLLLNAAWSPVFFSFRMIGVAFGVVVLLWIAVAATVVAFWRVRPLAGALMLPYLWWVTFALALNAFILAAN